MLVSVNDSEWSWAQGTSDLADLRDSLQAVETRIQSDKEVLRFLAEDQKAPKGFDGAPGVDISGVTSTLQRMSDLGESVQKLSKVVDRLHRMKRARD